MQRESSATIPFFLSACSMFEGKKKKTIGQSLQLSRSYRKHEIDRFSKNWPIYVRFAMDFRKPYPAQR